MPALPLRTMASPLEVMIEAGDLPVERPGRYDIRVFLLRGDAALGLDGQLVVAG